MAESWERTRLDHRSRQAATIAASALSLITDHGAPALTMAAIADAAEISRQTLYRYYDDVDAVLVGIAELVSSHDDDFTRLVHEQPDPRSQLDVIASAATSEGHGHSSAVTLLALLPPAGRDIVAEHQARACDLLSDVLRRGVEDGSFRNSVRPRTDAPLILGLLGAADSDEPQRAIALVDHLIQTQPQEPTP